MMTRDLAVKSGAARDFHVDGEAWDGVLVTPSAGIAKAFSRHPHTAQATCPHTPAGQ